MKKVQKVFLVVVHHKHGEDTYINATRDGATDALYEYAVSWWGDAFDREGDPPAPTVDSTDDKWEAITAYFERMEECGDEWYEFGEWEVGP